MRRVIGMIKPEALEQVYREWVKPYVGHCIGKQISVDGKTIRGASGMGDANFHMLSAWVHEDGLIIGQVKTEEKSNEITAIPKLLSALDSTGGIVSMDAMGCRRAIAAQIIEQKAQYVLTVKGNQPTLLSEIEEYFAWAQSDPIEVKSIQKHKKLEKGHGRISKWVVRTGDAGWFDDKGKWPLPRTFISVQRTCTRGDATSTQTAFLSAASRRMPPPFPASCETIGALKMVSIGRFFS